MRGSKWVMPRETRSSPSSEGQVMGKDQGCASRQLQNMLLHSACVCASNASSPLHPVLALLFAAVTCSSLESKNHSLVSSCILRDEYLGFGGFAKTKGFLFVLKITPKNPN